MKNGKNTPDHPFCVDWIYKNTRLKEKHAIMLIKTLLNYAKLLQEHNTRYRLVGDASTHEFFYRHVFDSLKAVRFYEFAPGSLIIDIGSGAGFPGIPVKLYLDEVGIPAKLISIESTQKKAAFQKIVSEELEIKGIEVICCRAEEAARSDIRASGDVVLTRAVGGISSIIEMTMPLLKQGGSSLLYRGRDAETELKSAEKACEELGAKAKAIYPYRVDETQPERKLVIIQKTRETPDKYPRRPGIPGKRPL